AKYFMRDARENVAAEAITPHRANLRSSSYINLQIDVDQETTGYLSYFDYIVERKGADASRPPANYRFDYENDYYTVWRRDEGIEVVRHKAVQPPFYGAERL